uniref:Uncharacterized LOC103392524 n=1 Tax=Cynoglossus semilaevis TaxID=244447 RepID=A0A3P8X2Z1_CYNSE
MDTLLLTSINAKKSLWQQVCEDYEAELHRPSSTDCTASSSVSSQVSHYSSSTHSPVFYGLTTAKVFADISHMTDWDPFPDLSGCSVAGKPSSPMSEGKSSLLLPKLKHSVTSFMEKIVFPVLLPGLEALLSEVQKHECSEEDRMGFNPFDFLTEWLYNHNPGRHGEAAVRIWDIPFVKDILNRNPNRDLGERCGVAKLVQQFWALQDNQETSEMTDSGPFDIISHLVSPTPPCMPKVPTPPAMKTNEATEWLTPNLCSAEEMSSTLTSNNFLCPVKNVKCQFNHKILQY